MRRVCRRVNVVQILQSGVVIRVEFDDDAIGKRAVSRRVPAGGRECNFSVVCNFRGFDDCGLNTDFFRVERAMSKLRHEFAKEFKNPLVGWWEVWGNKAINAIKENGRDGLFNFFRKFAKVVIENIRKEEELEAILAHNLKHVKGYSVEEFNEELKKEIIHNINNSFEYVNADTFEAAGCVKYAYKNWDEFYEILKEGFEDYINENF